MQVRIKGNDDEVAFYNEIVEIYEKYKIKINKALRLKNESELLDFCVSYYQIGQVTGHARIVANNTPANGKIIYENICKLAYIFTNILGRPLPDHIHNRIVLGPNNEWVKKYVEYNKEIKPYLFGLININKNNFKYCYLSTNGFVKNLALK